jgi:hypothetical protein
MQSFGSLTSKIAKMSSQTKNLGGKSSKNRRISVEIRIAIETLFLS